jgi:hypothetical protein
MTAKDLLLKLLEYEYRWTLPHVLNSSPEKTRRQQIESLQEAFGLSKTYINPLVRLKYKILGSKEEVDRAKHLNSLTTIEYLSYGEFLHDRAPEKNKELTERVKDVIRRLHPSAPADLHVNIKYMFADLMRFRRGIYKATRPNPKISEGFSAGLSYAHHLEDSLLEVIDNKIEEIDETLWIIFDPDKRNIDKPELVERFGYPTANLTNIDAEWRALTEEGLVGD